MRTEWHAHDRNGRTAPHYLDHTHELKSRDWKDVPGLPKVILQTRELLPALAPGDDEPHVHIETRFLIEKDDWEQSMFTSPAIYRDKQ